MLGIVREPSIRSFITSPFAKKKNGSGGGDEDGGHDPLSPSWAGGAPFTIEDDLSGEDLSPV